MSETQPKDEAHFSFNSENSLSNKCFQEKAAIPAVAREILENYSHVRPEDVEQHVYAIRDKAWEVNRYPCVGSLGFLDVNLCDRKSYSKILQQLKSDPTARHLDVGCCMGQDLRKLVYDGAKSSQLVGLELNQSFIDIGYDLFKDRDTLETEFICAGIFDEERLLPYAGQFTSVHFGHFLHLFNRNNQLRILRLIHKLLRPTGTVYVCGNSMATKKGTEVQIVKEGEPIFGPNEETWVELWADVVGATLATETSQNSKGEVPKPTPKETQIRPKHVKVNGKKGIIKTQSQKWFPNGKLVDVPERYQPMVPPGIDLLNIHFDTVRKDRFRTRVKNHIRQALCL